MAKDKYYKWVVEVRVHPIWVADGFNLTEDRLNDMLMNELECATGFEVNGRVVSAPDPKQIKTEQGTKQDGYEPRLCWECEQLECECEELSVAAPTLSECFKDE